MTGKRVRWRSSRHVRPLEVLWRELALYELEEAKRDRQYKQTAWSLELKRKSSDYIK